MVAESKYNKYLIEDVKRINSRFFLIQLHHNYYIMDYYNFKSYRWFYPLSTYYNNKSLHTWDIYAIEERQLELFKTSSPITLGNIEPNSLVLTVSVLFFPLFTWFFFYRLPIIVATFLSLLILVFIIHLIHVEISSTKRVLSYIHHEKSHVQKIKSVEKPRHRIMKILSNSIATLVLVFWLWLFIEMFFPNHGVVPRLNIIIFYLVLTLGISTMLGRAISGISYIPNTRLKYQIIENEEK